LNESLASQTTIHTIMLKRNIAFDEILKEYALGRITKIDPVPSGFVNRNYRVTTKMGVFLLRECLQQDFNSIQQEMKLMELLKKHHFPTAYPIPNKHGLYMVDKQSAFFTLYEFIEGKVPQPGRKTVEEIAPVVATLNTIPIPGDMYKKNALNYASCRRLITSPAFSNGSHKEIKSIFREEIEALGPCLEIKLPAGIIHGDIFPDNTLFIGNKLQAIIDFEEFAIDTLLFDVGMTINGFCFENNRFNPYLYEVFLKNYGRIRKLTGKEKELLPCYVRWTAVAMASWHLGKLMQKENRRQEKRIQELLDRVRSLDHNLLNQLR